jgi:hypothetical protein
MTLRAVALAVMTQQGQDTTNGPLVRRNAERLRVGLLRQRQAGIVRQEAGSGRTAAMWSAAT